MRRAARRPKELFVVTAMTAAVLVLAMSAVQAPISSAAAPALHADIFAACNNTFNGTKFPLEYKIDATPSVSPVPVGTNFTVDFNVTVVLSAGFLNGVYQAIGSHP